MKDWKITNKFLLILMTLIMILPMNLVHATTNGLEKPQEETSVVEEMDDSDDLSEEITEDIEQEVNQNEEINEDTNEEVKDKSDTETNESVKEEKVETDKILPKTDEEKKDVETENEAIVTDENIFDETEQTEEKIIPKSHVFTNAGPFLSALNNSKRLFNFRSALVQENDKDALKLNKKAVTNEDGSYTIALESYTTGTVKTETESVPIDIVLVLDQSGSMAWGFNDETDASYNNSRQKAMKDSVKSFIKGVGEKYSEETADHRISIVTFGSGSSTLQPWVNTSDSGVSTLLSRVDRLPQSPSGATRIDLGMENAQTLISGNAGYTGENTDNREKVVIAFTDGMPTSSNTFNTTVATDAIKKSKVIKDNGATVYSIGIFGGVNHEQLYGSQEDGYDLFSNGTVGSYWASGFITNNPNKDIPAGNRFLNYLSSNYKNATNIGLKTYSANVRRGYEITNNFERDNNNYYLTATDAASLDAIFKEIENNISQPNIQLGEETILKDIVTEYFKVPNNVNDIKTYTSKIKTNSSLENPQWEERIEVDDLNIQVENNEVNVKGFNYDDNFIHKDPDGNSKGTKLLVEFDIYPKDEFMGGNNVPTNEIDSGIYNKDGNVVRKFKVPTVDVETLELNVEAEDKYVYLYNDLTKETILENSEASYFRRDGRKLRLNLMLDDFGLEAWQHEFIDLETFGSNDKELGFSKLVNDEEYTLQIKATPKTSGDAKEQSAEDEANIYVFKPEINHKNGSVYYGESEGKIGDLNKYREPRESVKWTNDALNKTDEEKNMDGEKPGLTYDYIYSNPPDIKDGHINTKEDIYVDVDVKIQDESINTHTKFKNPITDFDFSKGKFLIEVKTVKLKITKEGGTTGEPYVFEIQRDGKDYTEASITRTEKDSDSIIISELPVGKYTVNENTDWSWRFETVYRPENKTDLDRNNIEEEIIVENKKQNDNWLNGFSKVLPNVFGQKNKEGIDDDA